MSQKPVKKLILGGGTPPPSVEISKYATNGLAANARILFLTIKFGGALRYQQRCQTIFASLGFANFKTVIGNQVSKASLIQEIQAADLILIGSGLTLSYAGTFATGSVKAALVAAYEVGVPLLGFSAGSLIMPEKMLISSKYNLLGIQIKQGLGLVKDAVISAHYSKWREQNMLRKGVAKAGVSLGYGIDDGSYLVFEDDKPRYFGTIYIEPHAN